MRLRAVLACLVLLAIGRPASAQQRPLVTEDPEPIGAGRVLIEGGVDVAHDQHYPASGLDGNLVRLPTIGLSVGISSIAELQIDGGFYDRLSVTARNPDAPLANMMTFTGNTTHDVEDTIVGMKVRFLSEQAGRPAMAIRFATKLPNARNQSGLGTDTMDFFASLLAAKTVQSVRIVGNVGVGILSEPTNATSQNDVLTYGASFARALTNQTEVVGEFNGRVSGRSGPPPIGTESRGIFKVGGRYTHGSLRLDGGVFIGLTAVDPTVGVTAGFTYVFNAFTMP